MSQTSPDTRTLSADPEENCELFINEVLSSGRIWGLQADDGWAVCDSIEFEETEVFPFWSTEADAARHCDGPWKVYRAAAISLEEFLEDWLPGMHEDGALAGPNWDSELTGLEIEPADLAARLGATASDSH